MKTSVTIVHDKVTIQCLMCPRTVTGPIPSDRVEQAAVEKKWEYTDNSTMTNPIMICPSCNKQVTAWKECAKKGSVL